MAAGLRKPTFYAAWMNFSGQYSAPFDTSGCEIDFRIAELQSPIPLLCEHTESEEYPVPSLGPISSLRVSLNGVRHRGDAVVYYHFASKFQWVLQTKTAPTVLSDKNLIWDSRTMVFAMKNRKPDLKKLLSTFLRCLRRNDYTFEVQPLDPFTECLPIDLTDEQATEVNQWMKLF